MSQFQHHAVAIDYHVSGSIPVDPEAVTLLFVHGSYIDQTYWAEQVSYFSPSYQVVTLDLPGQGQSGRNRTDWSIEGYGDDVVALIKQLSLTRVVLIGHSMGGAVALEATVAYPQPIRSLIVIDFFKNAATAPPDEHQKQIRLIEQGLETDFADTNEQYARQSLVTPNTPIWLTDRIVAAYRQAYSPMGQATTKQLFGYYEREQELLPQLPVKLHLINVDYQPTNEEPLRKYVKAGYDVIHLPGTSHYPMLESPSLLNEAIEQMISEITR
ncbi:alpha/beta fold hydrolase [Spirosoma arcticum]